MYTIMCRRPLWARKVCPTTSGTIVQRRAQVLTGSLEWRWLRRSTFSNNFGSTKGPFLSDRPMFSYSYSYSYSFSFSYSIVVPLDYEYEHEYEYERNFYFPGNFNC